MNVIQFLIPKSATAYLTDSSSVRTGLEKMKFHGYRAIPVITARGKYAGTVTEGDFLRCVMEHGSDLHDLERIRIKEIINADFNPAQRIDVPLRDLFGRVTEQNFVPVVDDRGSFIGIVTRRKVMRHLCETCFADESELIK